MTQEKLGPAERIIQTVLTFADHVVHNRPGIVVPDASSVVGVRWSPVTHKEEGGQKIVYAEDRIGKKTVRRRLGILQENGRIKNDYGADIGRYQPAGIFQEVAAWMYRQIAEVWKLDNEFAAKWASYVFAQEHRDMKAVMAAFMLCQSRKGDPVKEGDQVLFFDDDFRDVGEAMMLIYQKGGRNLRPKDLNRIYDLLQVPEIAAINRELGFSKSLRKPFLGRWPKVALKWLRHREDNPKLLEGLVKEGYKTTVMELARHAGYKPESVKFFEVLRWKQKQSKDGRRELAIGQEVAAAESWAGKTETEICEIIEKTKPNWKRVVGLLPKEVGVTRAVMAASIEAGSLSDKDLIIFTPTMEELGLLQVPDVRARWEKAVKNAEDMRAANIAQRVKSKEVKDKLDEGADVAAQKAVSEVMRDLFVWVVVDISGSMEVAIEKAKDIIAKLLPAFPQDKLKVSVFNTTGREVEIKHQSAAGVRNAFAGIRAGGGTHYAQGVKALEKHKPGPNEDLLIIFIGDEEDSHYNFTPTIQAMGIAPTAFGLVKIGGGGIATNSVQNTAAQLGIPCFKVDDKVFSDPYAIPRTIRNLIASTPVGKATIQAAPRITLVETILKTELLKKPTWAEA